MIYYHYKFMIGSIIIYDLLSFKFKNPKYVMKININMREMFHMYFEVMEL